MQKKAILPLLALIAVFVLAILIAAGRPMPDVRGVPDSAYSRAGMSAGVRYVDDSSGNTVLVGTYGFGAAVTWRPAAATTVCFSSDPDAVIGDQSAAGTSDNLTFQEVNQSGTATVTENNCTGMAQYASEPLDGVPTIEIMSKRGVGWTGKFCTKPIRTDHGVWLFPGCSNDHDCVTHFSGGTCTRTDTKNGAVHMLVRRHSGNFSSASAWR